MSPLCHIVCFTNFGKQPGKHSLLQNAIISIYLVCICITSTMYWLLHHKCLIVVCCTSSLMGIFEWYVFISIVYITEKVHFLYSCSRIQQAGLKIPYHAFTVCTGLKSRITLPLCVINNKRVVTLYWCWF